MDNVGDVAMDDAVLDTFIEPTTPYNPRVSSELAYMPSCTGIVACFSTDYTLFNLPHLRRHSFPLLSLNVIMKILIVQVMRQR